MAIKPTVDTDDEDDIEFDIVDPPDEGGEDAPAVEEEAEEPDVEEEEEDLPEEPRPAAAAAAPDPEILRELAYLRDRLNSVEPEVHELGKARLDIVESGLTEAVEKTKTARGEALEQGDIAAFNRYDDHLNELRRRQGMLEQMRQATPARRQPQPRPEAPPRPEVSPQAKDWMQRNRWFNADDLKDEASQTAIHFSNQLLAQGFRGDDPRHYEEVDKRMKKQFPKLYGGTARRTPAAAASGRRPTAAAPDGGDAKKRAEITRGTYQNFKLAGFDVEDPKVRAQMVKAVNETMSQHSFKARA